MPRKQEDTGGVSGSPRPRGCARLDSRLGRRSRQASKETALSDAEAAQHFSCGPLFAVEDRESLAIAGEQVAEALLGSRTNERQALERCIGQLRAGTRAE